MKKLQSILFTFAWIMLGIYILANSFLNVGLDANLYYELQMRENVPETAGISEENLLHLDGKLAMYLDGWGSLDAAKDESLMIHVNGVLQPAFNDRELQHMLDCQRLFRLLRDVNLASGLLAGILVLVCTLVETLYGLNLKKRGGISLKPIWLGTVIVLAPIAIFAIWAAINFNSAFNFFHRLLFTNDLWLLNPETDLLIRICPASMFAYMGLRIGLRSAAVLLGIPALLTAVVYFERRKRKKNEIADI